MFDLSILKDSKQLNEIHLINVSRADSLIANKIKDGSYDVIVNYSTGPVEINLKSREALEDFVNNFR